MQASTVVGAFLWIILPKSIKELRDKCKTNNEIIDGKLTKNYLFNSPSYAAMFVLGMSRNGRTEWKTKEGINIKELEERGINNL